jgi:DNA-binding IclR family transcriptional regulator
VSLELLSPHDRAFVDAVAARVLELLEERQATPRSARLVDAATLAGMLGLSRSTVYEHAAELGALEVGASAKPRLRFDPQAAVEAWTRRHESERSLPDLPAPAGVVRRRRRSAARSTPGLLPVRGQDAA